jgi:hypothetical protein
MFDIGGIFLKVGCHFKNKRCKSLYFILGQWINMCTFRLYCMVIKSLTINSQLICSINMKKTFTDNRFAHILAEKVINLVILIQIKIFIKSKEERMKLLVHHKIVQR